LLLLAVAGLVPFLRKQPSELPVYVLGAERMREGSEIYRTSDAKPFTYPPFFALPFVPLVGLPEGWQRTIWYFVTLAALAGVLVCIWRFAGPELEGSGRTRAWFWVLLAALCGRHLLAVFENQSHDMLVLLCTAAAAAAWAGSRDRPAGARGSAWAGAWAGLGAACKATPGLFALPFLLRPSWPALLAAGLAGAAATLLPDLLLPRADGRLWVVAWIATMVSGLRPGGVAELSGTWTAGSILNQSLSGTLYRLTTPVPAGPASPWEIDAAVVALAPDARRLVVLAGQVLVLIAVAWLARGAAARAAPPERAAAVRFGQAAAVACGMVLLSPMSSKSHFGVLLLPVALALVLACRGVRDPWLRLLLLLVFVAGTLSSKGIVRSRLGNLLLAYGSVTWTAVFGLLLAARSIALLRRAAAGVRVEPRPAAPAPS
jgi:hypothetical protein